MGEFELIDLFLRAFPPPRAAVGPGDDCAVVRVGMVNELCVTTDAIVEGVHFTRPAFSLGDVGHKALAVNLSDLAAMGAAPSWFLCAIAMPKSYGAAELRAIARGMAPLAKAQRVSLVGGNLSSASELSITVTAGGLTARGSALLRGGASEGELLYVSGTLGEAAEGLERLRADPNARGRAVTRQKRPIPRVRLGLIARHFASAAIDVSDGFEQDLLHLCKSSGVAAEVELERLPGSPGGALPGGEDYELLLAVPPSRAGAFERACRRASEQITRVGVFRRGKPRVIFLPTSAGGARSPARSTGGFDHFRETGATPGVRSRR